MLECTFFYHTTHLIPYSTTKPNSHSQMTTSIDTTTTTAPQQQLRNHGQKWTAEEDLQLKDAPGLDDDHFSLLLGRSTHAVQSRRAMLAARLHATTGRPVVECAEQMCANVTKTLFIAEGGDGEERMKKKKERQLDGVRVGAGGGQERKKVSIGIDRYSQMNSIKPRPMASYSARSHAATAPVGVVNVASKQASPISIVCSFIKRHAGGDMDELWAQDALVPTLVQYHAGFMAYAAFLKAKWLR